MAKLQKYLHNIAQSPGIYAQKEEYFGFLEEYLPSDKPLPGLCPDIWAERACTLSKVAEHAMLRVSATPIYICHQYL